jgi:primosomal protein N' (replication factor Y)
MFAHKNGAKAKLEMENVVGILQTITTVEVIGFGASPIEKIADKYRFSILLRSQKSTDLIRAIKLVKTPMMEIDMDPLEFT